MDEAAAAIIALIVLCVFVTIWHVTTRSRRGDEQDIHYMALENKTNRDLLAQIYGYADGVRDVSAEMAAIAGMIETRLGAAGDQLLARLTTHPSGKGPSR